MVTDEEMYKLRERVIQLEGQVAFLYKHLGVTFVPEVVPEDPRLIEQIRNGNLLGAIKIHREIHGSGLAEAKQAVEAIKAKLGH